MTSSHNELLQALNKSEIAKLGVRKVSMKSGTLLHEVACPIEHVYFPLGGIVCLATVLSDGGTIANAFIGREGVVGYGRTLSLARSIVAVSGDALAISVPDLREAARQAPSFRTGITHFNDLLMAQINQTVACHASHTLEGRICYWLLSMSDRLRSDSLCVTQAALAQLMGVHRGSMNAALAKLQANGAIALRRRGFIDIDRERIGGFTCECASSLSEFKTRYHAAMTSDAGNAEAADRGAMHEAASDAGTT